MVYCYSGVLGNLLYHLYAKFWNYLCDKEFYCIHASTNVLMSLQCVSSTRGCFIGAALVDGRQIRYIWMHIHIYI